MLDIPPPTQVLLLVFTAWTVGTAIGGAFTRLDPAVQKGHFKVVWLTAAAFALAGGFAYALVWTYAALCVATFMAIYGGWDRVLGIVAAFAGAGLLAAVAVDGAGGGLTLVAYTAATTVLLGSVTNAMLLGHWHLNQPRLGTDPIRRLVRALWVGLAIFAAASVVLAFSGEGAARLGGASAATFAVFSMVLTAMVSHLVRTRSIMSATGILYLEVLLCLAAAFTGSLGALAQVG